MLGHGVRRSIATAIEAEDRILQTDGDALQRHQARHAGSRRVIHVLPTRLSQLGDDVPDLEVGEPFFRAPRLAKLRVPKKLDPGILARAIFFCQRRDNIPARKNTTTKHISYTRYTQADTELSRLKYSSTETPRKVSSWVNWFFTQAPHA